MSGKCIFNDIWLKNPDYHDWLLSDKDRYRAKCRLCSKTFSVASMGESALKSHLKSKKHQSINKIRSSSGSLNVPFSQPRLSVVKEPAIVENKSSNPIVLQDHLCKNDILNAEIIWTLHCIKNHYSYSSNQGIDKIFRAMFKDSQFASLFSCGEKKTAYYSTFGIGPYLKDCLHEELVKEDAYVLLFDESLNQMTQTKQLDIHVRYWSKDRVKTMFFTSVFLGHSTAEDLLEVFKSNMQPLKLCKIYQVSMDGPNVNFKFFDNLQKHIATEFQNKQILNIGSCSLHTVHNAFKSGCEASSWEIDDFLSSLYYLFKDSPARREDFLVVSETGIFPKKFVKHRWLENVPTVERAIKLIPDLQKFVSAVQKKEVPKPICKSFLTVQKHLKDKSLIAKLHAFLSIAKILQPFLVTYQTDKPMSFFLAEDLKKILSLLLQRFIQADTLKLATTLQKLLKLDFENPKLHCKTQDIFVGFVANKILKKLKNANEISDRELFDIRMQSKAFCLSTVLKIVNKTPIQYSIARNLSCLDPRNMIDKKKCLKTFKLLLNSLAERALVAELNCDVIIQEFSLYLDEVIPPSLSRFKEFDVDKMRVDELFFETMNVKRYAKVWGVVKNLILISHGQATVERGFSTNKKIEVENLKEHSYIAQRVICDHINTVADGDVLKVHITKRMQTYVTNARQRYMTYLEEEKIRNGKKRKSTEIHDNDKVQLVRKKARLESDIIALVKSADEYAQRAEEEGDISLITKSNSLRKSANEKQVLLTDLKALIEKK